MSGEGPSTGRERNYVFVKSKRGGKLILHAGHEYSLHRKNKSSSVWTCSKKRRMKCGGAIKLDSNSDFVHIQTSHIFKCKPDFFKSEVRHEIDKLSEEVGINFEPIQQMYEKKVIELKNRGPSSEIPTFRSVKSSLYRSRNKKLNVQKTTFKEPTEIVIPEKFKPNLLFDYCEDGKRIILFISPKARNNLKNVKVYLCDGTFDCCPKPFKQVFSIHGDVTNKIKADETNVVPMFYALLIDKNKSTYVTLFQKLKDYLPNFTPKKFIIDFETATISAIEQVFPEAIIHGCFVHFQRSVYRKAKSLLLLDHEETTTYVRMCICLAYLPEHEIEDGWLAVMENSLPATPVTKFNDYFVEQWLEPAGMISKWCCYNQQHRTTNLVEAWNQRLQCHLGPDPSLLSFYQMVTTDIAIYDTAQERLQKKGTPITKKKRRSILNEEVIDKLTQKYENGLITMITFLKEISKIVIIREKDE